MLVSMTASFYFSPFIHTYLHTSICELGTMRVIIFICEMIFCNHMNWNGVFFEHLPYAHFSHLVHVWVNSLLLLLLYSTFISNAYKVFSVSNKTLFLIRFDALSHFLKLEFSCIYTPVHARSFFNTHNECTITACAENIPLFKWFLGRFLYSKLIMC